MTMTTHSLTRWLVPALLAATIATTQAKDADASLYMVIDISGGAEAAKWPVRYTSTPPNLEDNACRTTEMWFRRILPGTFMMGSPSDELGRKENEVRHKVTLTKPFYIGVFQVTQKQMEYIKGEHRSHWPGETRPVTNVSDRDLRGAVNGTQWPASDQIDEESLLAKMRAKTSLTLELPTEAQWEYACRAGTTTALNSGKNLTTEYACPNMAEVGRYKYNHTDGKGESDSHHTTVGMYQPNAWGLYDMHGNVVEWCLDWYGEDLGTADATDPKGADSGEYRILRGGNYGSLAGTTRSAFRYVNPYIKPGSRMDSIGFRLIVIPAE